MKKKLLVLTVLTALVLSACGTNKESKVEEKPQIEKSESVRDVVDPIQEGDIDSERKFFNEFKPKIYKSLEITYDLNAPHNQGKDQAYLKASKGIDKVSLDSYFESIEGIITTCESEKRYFRKSEMDMMGFYASEIKRLSDKWVEFTESK